MYKRIYNLVALLLLALFFAPYIVKLQQWDLLLLLVGGLVLPAVEFFTGEKD